jgi:glycosyltransferase involved in cell wall biosynthesis
VVLASGWFPNRDGAGWFCRTCWPHVRAQCPRAVLHLFGRVPGIRSGPTVVVHEPPVDSREAFSPEAILAVPLRIASGVRVKILEAWARGVPVVATPQAAAGLAAHGGQELLIVQDPPEFARAIGRLPADRSFARASVEAGRALLGARHDPLRVAERLASIYAEVARAAISR